MRRKLIKQGAGALTVCLPRQWTGQRSLKAGDEVDLEVIDKNIVIKSNQRYRKKECFINISSSDQVYLRNLLNQLYRIGYEKITLNINTKEQSIIIQKLIQMFSLGFEITYTSSKSIVAESISEPGAEQNQVILRRIFYLIKESFQAIKVDKNLCQIKDINRLTKKVTQYDNYLRRHYARSQTLGSCFSWELSNTLLLIQHSLYNIYRLKAKTKKMIELGKLFDDITAAFFKASLEDIENLSSYADKLTKSLIDIHYSCEIARLLYQLCNPMIGLILMQVLNATAADIPNSLANELK